MDISITLLTKKAVFFLAMCIGCGLAQAQVTASAQSKSTEEIASELNKNLGWIKAKIEKYGGKAGSTYAYQVSYSVANCQLHVVQKAVGEGGTNYEFTMNLLDFKEVKQSGRDIEILCSGTSVIGKTGDAKSAWSGIRINQFTLGESSILDRMQRTFETIYQLSNQHCR